MILNNGADALQEAGDTSKEIILRKKVAEHYNRVAQVGNCNWSSNGDPVVARIRQIDSSYAGPTNFNYRSSSSYSSSSSASADGCYVATCVYGSYDCPEVWTLRRYRDYNLAETWYGRIFIQVYYAISPTIVKLFGNAKWFRHLCKGKLDKMVGSLKEQGYESTPYEDRYWK